MGLDGVSDPLELDHDRRKPTFASEVSPRLKVHEEFERGKTRISGNELSERFHEAPVGFIERPSVFVQRVEDFVSIAPLRNEDMSEVVGPWTMEGSFHRRVASHGFWQAREESLPAPTQGASHRGRDIEASEAAAHGVSIAVTARL